MKKINSFFQKSLFGFIVKRLLQTFLILFVVSSILFTLVSFIPGNICHEKLTEEQCAVQETAYGLRGPFIERYGKFITGIPQGKLGVSARVQPGVPVEDIISDKLMVSATVGVLPLIFGMFVGIVMGVLAALRHNKMADTLINFLTVIFVSVPSFVFAFFLQYTMTGLPNEVTTEGLMGPIIFAIVGAITATGYQLWSNRKKAIDNEKSKPLGMLITSVVTGVVFFLLGIIGSGFVKPFPILFDREDSLSFILPMFALSFFVIATVTRYVRAEMLEVLNSDYILLARAKGVNKRKLYFTHALRNALIPAITVVAPLALTLLTGTIVIERVFTIPGMGGLLLQAIESHDINIVLGLGVVFTVIYSVILLIVDVTYGLVDPRIRIGGGE